MKKTNKRDSLNLLFSSLLVVGYIVCSYFFLTMAATTPLAPYINALVFVVFGLIVFYATRVGEGKVVKRFSLWTLILLDIPSLYIVIAQLVPAMPLHTQIANLGGLTTLEYSPLFILAAVALGYGIPYTFISGFEAEAVDNGTDPENDVKDEDDSDDNEEDAVKGEYFLCDSDTPYALLVVDDDDLEFNKDKEIKLSDVTPTSDEVKVGSFVIYVDTVLSDEELDQIEKELNDAGESE